MKWKQFYKVDQTVLTTYLEAIGNRDILPKLLGLPGVPYKYIDGMIYFREKELEILENEIRKDLINLTKKSMKEMIKVSDIFVEECKKISKINLKKTKKKGLLDYYKNFCKAWLGLLGLGTTPLYFENVVEEELIKKNKGEEIIKSIITLTKDTFGIKEKKKIYKIAIKIYKENIKKFGHNKEIHKLISKHLEKWSWIETHILLGGCMTKESVIKRLKEILKKNPENELKKINEEKKKAINNYNKTIKENPNIKDLAEITQLIIYTRDYRYAMACKGCYFIIPFLTYFGKRLNLSYMEFVSLLPKEVEDIVNNNKKINKKILKKRIKSFAINIFTKRDNVLINKELGKEKKEERKEIIDINEIKGIIANKGFVKGKVKIILYVKDLKKIKKGDILIAQQTIPDFVPSMHKVAAIITDLGGITSHAAMVSREFGIPCVVGTKIATKVFKDNDLVEVNADKGLIRKIK